MSWFEQEKNLIEEGEHSAVIFDVHLDRLNDPWRLSIQYKLENNQRIFQNFKFDEKGKKWLTWQMSQLCLNERAKELCEDQTEIEAIALAYFAAAEEIKGTWVDLDVKHSEYNGKTYANASVLGRLESGPTQKPDFGVSTKEQIPF